MRRRDLNQGHLFLISPQKQKGTVSPQGRQNRPLAGIGYMLVAVFCFASMDTLAKFLGSSYPVSVTMAMRAVFGLLPVAVAVYLAAPRKKRLPLLHPGPSLAPHMLRGGLIFAAQATFFSGIVLMPLADGMALVFASPLVVAVFSGPLLGEWVGPRRWLAVVVGAFGVVLITRPSGGLFAPPSLLVLAGVLFYSLVMITARRYADRAATLSLTFWATVFNGLPALLLLPFFWATPTPTDFLLYVLLGIMGGCGALFVTHAVRLAEASLVAPFDYTALIWATLFGWLIWGETPGLLVWLGVLLVALSGLYVLRREGKTKTAPAP